MNLTTVKAKEWREGKAKVCPVCEQAFSPSPGMRPSRWEAQVICDRFCGAANSHGQRMVIVDPLDQVKPHQRLKWLRMSASRCGKKVPWSLEIMGASCEMSASALGKVECGGGTTGGWMKAAAARLRVPASLFTVPVERFAKVVTEAGLSAKLSVPKEERRAA